MSTNFEGLLFWMALELMFYVGFVGNQLFSKLLYCK